MSSLPFMTAIKRATAVPMKNLTLAAAAILLVRWRSRLPARRLKPGTDPKHTRPPPQSITWLRRRSCCATTSSSGQSDR